MFMISEDEKFTV